MGMKDKKQLMLGFVCLATSAQAAFGQALRSRDGELNRPRVEVFAGYSYWHPMSADINYVPYKPLPYGAEGSVTYFLKPWLGIQAEAGAHVDPVRSTQYTTGFGLQLQGNVHKFVPFAHALAGPSYFGGPALNVKKWGWTGTAGVGLDWIPSLRHEWFGVRLLQADYQYNYNDFGPLQRNGALGGLAKINTIAGSAGLVLRLGGAQHADMVRQMSCSAAHVEVYPGDPVNVASQLLGFNELKPIQFTWTTSGGRILGKGGDVIAIDTAGLPVGDYRVMGTAVQDRHGRESASCNANFTIRPYDPPTITCSALPATLYVGGRTTITATGSTVRNRPLTYTFVSTAGTISQTGNVATLSATTAGDIAVTCSARDDLQHMATATTNVTVSVTRTAAQTSLPALPLQSDMCSVSFTRDRRRPARVNNEAKACLDDISLAMQHQQDATLVLVGDHTRREGIALAAERAVNVKQYLSQEKGIDPSRIQVRAESAGQAQVISVFLPIGSTFNQEGRVVNEKAVVRHGEAYGSPGGIRTASSPRNAPTRHTSAQHRSSPRRATRPRITVTPAQ
ncbi:OmpA family protein [Terriglobus roseus]|uniref:Outer membrane protein OmpA n=1 Tax=Terriglobus roseus TaxID=392734 RepID=A0A1H4J7X6_9BACT|nr:OmpA family protein [Terriglobus roseus]SEB42363.1 Outer membrane protein OmpA [Terriglobus roseus]